MSVTSARDTRLRKARKRQIIRDAKNVPCADCGVRYPYYVMEFDHVNGDKLGTVSWMINISTVGSLVKEIDKCEVVCANCHRIRTHVRNQYYPKKED